MMKKRSLNQYYLQSALDLPLFAIGARCTGLSVLQMVVLAPFPVGRLGQPQLERKLVKELVPQPGEDVSQPVLEIRSQLADHFGGVLVQEQVERGTQHLIPLEQVVQMNAHTTDKEGHFHLLDKDRILRWV